MPTSLTIPPASLQLRNTTIFAVRHADVLAGPDPHLSAAGQNRATELIRVIGGNGITAIYASQFVRTQETAQPLATQLGLTVKVVNAADSASILGDVRAHHPGQSVLIVGHSDTIPGIIVQCGGPQVPVIGPAEFDRLFVVTMAQLRKATIQAPPLAVRVPELATCTVVSLKYGAKS